MRLRLATLPWVLTSVLTGCALPPPAPAPGAVQATLFSSQTVRYRCAGGTEIEVAYLNLNNGGSFAALHHGGRTALLQSRPAASGVRYIALDEQHSLRWHTQGMDGTLRFLAADHTAREQTLLADCKAQPAR